MNDAVTIAKISQNAMVLSLQNAKSPTVWRAKLESLDEMSFKVESAGKGKYALNASKADSTETIAEFSTKSAAEQALSVITETLFNLDAYVPSSDGDTVQNDAISEDGTKQNEAPNPVNFSKWRAIYWASFVIVFMALLGLIYLGTQKVPLGSDINSIKSIMPDKPNKDTMGGRVEDMPDLQQGRPLSADDFFNNR